MRDRYVFNPLVGILAVVALVASPRVFAADEAARIEQLEQRLADLESRLAQIEQALPGKALAEALASLSGEEDRSEDGASEEHHRNDASEQAYIDKVRVYDVTARYFGTYLEERVPGVQFKLQNTGYRTLSKVRVTAYFLDTTGTVIAEEHYTPVNTDALLADDAPLRPNYIWQLEQGKFYKAPSVPSEWQEGAVAVVVSAVEFASEGDTGDRIKRIERQYREQTPPRTPAEPALGGSTVRRLQTALAEEGLYEGQIDGVWGPRTEAAVRAFQQREDLPSTGKPTPDVLARLGVVPNETGEAEARSRAEFEERDRQAERERVVTSARQEYIPAIQNKVANAWLRPPGIEDGLAATVRVRIGPGGIVTAVQVIRSSGNAAFDRSAQEAVRRAEPLPFPQDRDAAAALRELTFVFQPEA